MNIRNFTVSMIGRDQDGFVLVLGMVSLVALTLIGVWAMNTSSIEQLISGNHQRFEEGFQTTEGGAVEQAVAVGYNLQPWYAISNINIQNQILVPTTNNDFDPDGDKVDNNGNPILDAVGHYNSAPDDQERSANNEYWPMENLVNDPADALNPDDPDEFDYLYLTTFLYTDTAPQGYNPANFRTYMFRFNSSQTIDLELGGKRVGPFTASF